MNEDGRQRVLENERKNVHATVLGTLCDEELKLNDPVSITYNPYKFDSFVTKDTHTPITGAEAVSIEVADESVRFHGQNVTTQV